MKPELQEAERIAQEKGLRITCKRGVFNVWRNTIPRLTFIGSRVSESAVLELVRKAARNVFQGSA